MNHALNQLQKRRRYFNELLPKLKGADTRNDIKNQSNTCAACGYPTLEERNAWEICSICFWEDDGQDDYDADKVYGGPNGEYSLTTYRQEWQKSWQVVKSEPAEIASKMIRLDELIQRDQKSDISEVMVLVKDVSDWFEAQRKEKLGESL